MLGKIQHSLHFSRQDKQAIVDKAFDWLMLIPGALSLINHFLRKLLDAQLPLTALPETLATLHEAEANETTVLQILGLEKPEEIPENLVLSGAIYVTNANRAKLAPIFAQLSRDVPYGNIMHTEVNPTHLQNRNILLRQIKALYLGGTPEANIGAECTTGGTPSIMHILHGYCHRVRRVREAAVLSQLFHVGTSDTRPIILVDSMRHPAYDKFATIGNARIIVIPRDTTTGRISACEVEKAIITHGAANIAAVITSNPNYADGVIEPIREIAAVTDRYAVPLHVDSCLGGPVTAHATDRRFHIDFSIPGVTSISYDFHKGEETPKGCSVVMYRDEQRYQLAQHLVHPHLTHPCGAYCTPGFSGSQSAFEASAALATRELLGALHYRDSANATIALTRELAQAINKQVNSIEIIGNPDDLINVFAIRIDKSYFEQRGRPAPNIHVIAEKLKKAHDDHGAHYNYKFNAIDGEGEGAYHLCITPRICEQNAQHAMQADLTAALNTIVAATAPNEKPRGQARAYGHINLGPVTLPGALEARVGARFEEGHRRFSTKQR